MVADNTNVVIIGGGFAGVACAKQLADQPQIQVDVIDKAGYHQFQPLLYQVATAELTFEDVRFDLARIFRDSGNVRVRKAHATTIDPRAMTVTLDGGETVKGDVLVLAAGAQPNFFRTAGAVEHSFPLYSVDDARKVRGRIVQLFEDVARQPELADAGALTFVVVGGGPTGVETAGALAELVHDVMPHVYHDAPIGQAEIVLVDLGSSLLNGFSADAGDYAAKQLQRRGVKVRLGVAVKEVAADHVTLADDAVIPTRLCVWGGGEKAADIATASPLPRGRGGRIRVEPDLTVPGYPDIYALGDIANIPSPEEEALPQLGSVAQQAGRWAGKNISARVNGQAPQPFHYRDKGIMAMIGRNAAVAEMGAHRHEIHGRFAFAAWLGVHAELLSDVGAELKVFVAWANEFYMRPHHRSAALLEPSRLDMPRINWDQKG
jgi:NADH:quinone reductase (non-electrogenic)